MEKKWWHNKVIYQIYPKSFMDLNNDGIGDIKGIISKLDYLKLLGVDILWITPFYKSPMKDNGYDVADYLNINEMFGSNEDMDKLIDECKKKDMYIMMDIVANHTSDKHRWFIEASSSKDNKYRDYYIWKDSPLYDLQSTFGGSAWEYDKKTNQYYFHEFAKEQPDLNWENPVVMDEMAKCINYWLDKGIKGIRFDVIHLIGKEIENNILSYGPTLHQKVKELYNKSYGKYDIVTVGEAWGNLQNAIDFTKPENKELNMVFQFEVTSSTCDFSKYGKFSPRPIDMEFVKKTLIKYQEGLNDISWNALFVENHDLGRAINKFGSLDYYDKSAKEIATFMYFQKGTPYIYQGQELGMTNIKMNSIDEYDDVEVHGFYKEYVLEKKVMSLDTFMDACAKEARDNNRTPMQWDDSINAGFNKGAKPWLKINNNYKYINAKAEISDENSIFNYYKKLLALRKQYDVFTYGRFEAIDVDKKDIFSYLRYDNNDKFCILCNMNSDVINYELKYDIDKVVLSNYNKKYDSRKLTLEPYEAIVYKVK